MDERGPTIDGVWRGLRVRVRSGSKVKIHLVSKTKTIRRSRARRSLPVLPSFCPLSLHGRARRRRARTKTTNNRRPRCIGIAFPIPFNSSRREHRPQEKSKLKLSQRKERGACWKTTERARRKWSRAHSPCEHPAWAQR